MRWRVFFFISLGVNLALAVVWFVYARRIAVDRAAETGSNTLAAPTIKTNVVIRRQFFSWEQVESDDYPTYIANLRQIGCPEQTIRDIIIAEINSLFARRMATELVTPEQQWWRSEPDTNVVRLATEKLKALEDERRTLLARLLGAGWESGDMLNLPRPSRRGVVLDGSVLGSLSTETKQAVEDVSARAEDRLRAYLDAQRLDGKNPDPVELAKFRQQTRTELANILTPVQLEEYLLRYSQEAVNLRGDLGQLQYFNATPDEFRALFRATDSIDQQLELLAGSTDANSNVQRNLLLQQRENAVKVALGADRYQQYTLLHDSGYREAYAFAQDSGSPDAAKTIYEINLAAAQQAAAVSANTNLTPTQLAVQLKRIELEQLKAHAVAMGMEVPPEETPVTNAPAVLQPPPSHSYVLGFGESAAGIAMRYNVSLGALQAVNPDVNLNRLRPGDTIRVPDSRGGQ
jgi:hypothetical protein